MFDIHSTPTHAKAACFLLFICLAVAVLATTNERKVEASNTTVEANSRAQESSATAQTKGKVNGKIVFASDRKSDGRGFRLWTMNSDGSNRGQLTYIPAGPNPPSYVYDDGAKWSPDGSKIAFTSRPHWH